VVEALAQALQRLLGGLALGAARADLAEPVEPGPDVADLEPVQPQGAPARGRFRRQNISYLSWVLGARLGSALPQPVTQVLTQCRRAGRHPALASPGLQGLPGSEGLVVGPALDVPAAADANRSRVTHT